MRSWIHFIPVVTTVVALLFAPMVYRRWKERRSGPHLLWWAAGILVYGVGTFTEGFTSIFGWNEWIFRSWYISGALLGGAPLAQGTVYLLLSRKTANRLTVGMVAFVVIASVGVLLTPINMELVETHRLTGSVMEWQRVRLFSPFINTYAAIFLIGGAVLSAWRFHKRAALKDRFIGNVYIAVGALLPGIGGMATRFGYTEVLYVMELLGLLLIWTGYRYNVRGRPAVRGARAPAVEERIPATT